MRLATYNVENLFDRAKAMNLQSWAEGRPVLQRFAKLIALLGKPRYTAVDRTAIAALIVDLGMAKSDIGPFTLLRRNRGGLLKRPRSGGVEVIAEGRADWTGSLELIDEPIDELAMRHTARVIVDAAADVLGVVEAESRPVLNGFNRGVLPALGGDAYRHVMVIDGNDDRGIDVGLMSREGFPIGRLRSHVDDRLPNGGAVFSRDCPEFEVTTPGGARLVVLVNHFKSKGYGKPAESNARRRAQAARVAEIYRALRDEGERHVAILGDLNDTPDSAPLHPLLQATDLRDCFAHPAFDDGGHAGTHGACKAGDKIDFILLSPDLFDRVTAGAVERRGVWAGVRAKRWPMYDTLTREQEAASDHAALWVDLDL